MAAARDLHGAVDQLDQEMYANWSPETPDDIHSPVYESEDGVAIRLGRSWNDWIRSGTQTSAR
jgi:hypothetical protein